MNELTSLILPLIFIGLISLGVGVAAGLALASLRDAKVPTGKPPSRNAVEVLRIYRDRRSQALSVMIAGQTFKSADELAEKWRNAILRIVDDLQLWLGVTDIGKRIGPVSTATPVPKEVSPFSLQSMPATPPSGKDLAVSLGVAQATKPPSLDPTEIIAKAIAAEAPKEASETKSIAAQVDEILQERLAKSALKNRVIRILELPEGGMVVQVDNEEFEGVGDVPDPAVARLLRDSVAEWERRVSGV